MKRQRQRLVVAVLVGSGILAAALITALAPVPAMAQFRAPEPQPPPPDDWTAYLECSIVSATDHDKRDQIYKIDVILTTEKGQFTSISVEHTATSGARYSRSDQYTAQASIWKKPNVMEWYWIGQRGGRLAANVMLGEVWNDGTSWWYSEKLLHYGRQEYQMLSRCHVDPKGD